MTEHQDRNFAFKSPPSCAKTAEISSSQGAVRWHPLKKVQVVSETGVWERQTFKLKNLKTFFPQLYL